MALAHAGSGISGPRAKAWIESRSSELFSARGDRDFLGYHLLAQSGHRIQFFRGRLIDDDAYLLIFGSVVIIGVIAWLLVAGRQLGSFSAAGLALLLAGATGNVTDRIVHGAVTDFLQVWLRFLPWHIVNPWPTFNIADCAVTIGAILIVFDVLFRPASTRELINSQSVV